MDEDDENEEDEEGKEVEVDEMDEVDAEDADTQPCARMRMLCARVVGHLTLYGYVSSPASSPTSRLLLNPHPLFILIIN